MATDRKPKPRSGGASAGFGKPRSPRTPRFRGEEGGATGGADARDPYKPAQRPPRAREEGGRGFTVTLDPDVARVFRGDASVNKALRLVLQLMQVVQGPSTSLRTGPPKAFGDRPRPARPSYQGSDEARGFSRKPRFDAGDEGEVKEE